MNNENLSSEEAKKISTDDLLKKLKTTKKGLASSEVEKRRSSYGFNEIPSTNLLQENPAPQHKMVRNDEDHIPLKKK